MRQSNSLTETVDQSNDYLAFVSQSNSPSASINQSNDNVTLCTSDIIACMSSSHKQLTITASHTTISFFPTPLKSNDTNRHQSLAPLSCTLVFKANMPLDDQPPRRLQIRFLQKTCTDRNSVLVYEKNVYNSERFSAYDWNRLSWTGCEPDYDPLPDYIAREKELGVVLRVVDPFQEYSVRMIIKVDRYSPPENVLEIKQVSKNLGKSSMGYGNK